MLVGRSVGLTPEQVEARRRGVGGSDAAAILGIDPYKTALDIYELKLGIRQPDPPNAAMKRGTYLESITRRLYRELTGRRIRRLAQVQHPDHPFMMCNVDGVILSNKKRNKHDGPGVLEIKCPGIWAFAKIEREGLPLSYIVQMQHNLAVTGFSWGSFGLFNSDLWKMVYFDVVADLELHHAILLREREFWLQNVEKRVPPVVAPDKTSELYDKVAEQQKEIGGGELIVRNDAEWAEAASQYLEADEIAETGERLKGAAKDKLKALMGKPGAVEGAGLRCYWSESDGRVSFNREALAKSKPLDRLMVGALVNSQVMHDPTKTAILDGLVACEVNFELFEKRGKPFETFRAYRVKAGVGD